MDGSFRVGPWLVEPGLNTLSRNGATTHLEPKIMEVLLCLVRHAGESVSKEKVLHLVWSDSFVSDDVLTRSIYELRQAFEDDAREPRFIQTIPKRGYRLIAPVEWSNRDNPAKASVTQPAAASKLMLGAMLLVLLGILSGVGLRNRLAGVVTKNSPVIAESPDVNRIPLVSQPKRPAAAGRRDPELRKPARASSGLEQGPGISPRTGVGIYGVVVEDARVGVESTRLQSIPPDTIKKWLAGFQPLMSREFADRSYLTPSGNGALSYGGSKNAQSVAAPGFAPIQSRFQNIPPEKVEKPTWSRMRALVRFNADGRTAVAFARPLLADSFGDPGAPRDELGETAALPVVVEPR